MRTRREIEAKIAEIEADERFHYEPALVQVNAPLALIQVELKARHQALKWALEECEVCQGEGGLMKECERCGTLEECSCDGSTHPRGLGCM